MLLDVSSYLTVTETYQPRQDKTVHKEILFLFQIPNTVVPVMNGHPRDQAKVSVHDRWPLVRGTEGRAGGGAKCNTGYSLHDNIMHHHQRYSY